jgi:hypothetical protein
VRFDESVMPGLRPTVSYLDASRITPDHLAQLILDKLADAPGITSSNPMVTGVPRTLEGQRELLMQRPIAWEFLLFASVLLTRRSALEEKWRDNEIRYARRTGIYMDEQTALDYVSSKADDAIAIVESLNRVLSDDAQAAAFGAPGEPGNAPGIEHLATRVIDIYEELLDWAANLRGMGVPQDFRNLFDLAAQVVNRAIQQIRELVDYYVAQAENIPEKLVRGESVHLEIPLKIDIDDEVLSEFGDEVARLSAR